MNKTISINLGGFFFHIDENAYQTLTRYFDAVKRSLSPEGRDEIINDIESRIAELFQERLKSEKQVVGITEVEEVIAIMGQPEDYLIDEEPSYNQKSTTYSKSTSRTRRLYRDRDNSILGGVAAGFGHYFGIDPLWVRILFIISPFISFGTSVLIYLVLWILIPEAVTTAQKLEMRGEPINISNIEKKVKEGIGEISDKINNLDSEKITNTAKSGANQIGKTLGDVFMAIFKFLAKFIGAFIILFASMTLLGVIIGSVVMIFTSSMPDTFIFNHIETPFDFEVPLWIQGILLLFSVGIPFLALLLLGLKLLVTNMKPIGNYFKYTLLAVWLLSIIGVVYFGLKQATAIGYDGKSVQKEEFFLEPQDTLYVKMSYDDYFTKSVYEHERAKYTHDANNNEIIFSTKVRVHFLISETDQPYIQIEKSATGKSHKDAKDRSDNINYHFEIQKNKINLDNYFTTDFKNKFRDQEVNVYLYLPKGVHIKPDKSIQDFDWSDNKIFDLHHNSDEYIYQVADDEIVCLDCPSDEDDFDFDEITDTINENVSLKINNKELNINVKKDEINIKTK
ncbi:hypothetical protein DI487_11150 [Flavobacterium sediminis]|uniref:Uncharacterized protein n=1 Tax=Flavobacterium sediminis TaxID=2201181 RepID=A0A2U8QWU8_9FLAO|nr:PspC domain-containing protein [Flavobacterium sediminis]AWM14354.1 hypothetical protein DI487_11150 [Flavobacterium sediminis]